VFDDLHKDLLDQVNEEGEAGENNYYQQKPEIFKNRFHKFSAFIS